MIVRYSIHDGIIPGNSINDNRWTMHANNPII